MHLKSRSTCAGAVLVSNSWDESLYFICRLRHMTCCKPLDTTEMPAMISPSKLLLITVFEMVLQIINLKDMRLLGAKQKGDNPTLSTNEVCNNIPMFREDKRECLM